MALKLSLSRSTPMGELPQIMGEAEVAAYVGVTKKQMRRLSYERRGPKTIKIGRQHFVRRESLIAWIDAQES